MDIKSKLFGFAAMGTALASGAFASEGSTTTNSMTDWAAKVDSSDFGTIISNVAPVAIAIVCGVAGVRVAIKLINRAAGK